MKYTADFETNNNEKDCRVWGWGLCEIGTTYTEIGNNIGSFMGRILNAGESLDIYFHNLKFDGEFIIYWLFENDFEHNENYKMLTNKEFNCCISDTGQFYSITIKHYKYKITLIDSLKILPFSISEVSKSFNLKEEKLKINYNQKREINHIITETERKYIKNDVSIMSLALNTLFEQKLKKRTQASNAFADFKLTDENFEKNFPILSYEMDKDIRRAYKGGYVYLNPKYENKDIREGIQFDINSLYPYIMREFLLPYGKPQFFKGKYQKDNAYPLFIQCIKCNFILKEGYLPTISKKHISFKPAEYLKEGLEEVLYLTNYDFELFLTHYEVTNIEFMSGYKFKGSKNLFKSYIDKWIKVKIESELSGNMGMRTLAKLMLNALYGRFALRPDLMSKYPYYTEGIVKYKLSEKQQREPIYIPVSVFITSGARFTTINSAQNNFERFVYSDTDSLKLIGYEMPTNIEINSTKLGAWKYEGSFKKARFIQPKRYIIYKNAEFKKGKIIKSHLEVTCASMPHKCHKKVTWQNFKLGHTFKGKLVQTRVKGGIVLKDTIFTLR